MRDTTGFHKNLLGIARLFRIIPVLAWSFSAITLGVGLAMYRTAWPNIRLSQLIILVFIAAMFQGLAAHAINDIYDWLSGTDKHSQGIMSGGTRVIGKNLLGISQLKIIGVAALAAGIAGGLYLVWAHGFFILVLLAVGVWSTIAYSMPPVQLAYRPLAGEWLGAWPAMVACTLGTFYVLTGTITSYAVAGGLLHATFSVAWLMQHHLPDIDADLLASPPKMTTVAFVSQRWGKIYTKYLVMGYFLLLVPMGVLFGLLYNPAFLVSIFFCSACAFLALTTNPSNIRQISARQVGMILLSVGHAVSLAALFALRTF